MGRSPRSSPEGRGISAALDPLPQDRIGFSPSRRTTFARLGAQGPSQETPCVSAELRFR